ncbi:MAG: GNAT family N-acetyltransferase [Clostridia bacterium]|nr:GNAT family N-acetyltransferase [Clostridia bacterium]
MITLQPISNENIELISQYYKMSVEDKEALLNESEMELHDNKFFKMFAILNDEKCVGTISLYEHSASVISIGPEVFDEYRRCGYATEAMIIAMNIAKSKDYKIVCQQIRTNNFASMKMHAKLGFETDNYLYVNKNNNNINIYLKSL